MRTSTWVAMLGICGAALVTACLLVGLGGSPACTAGMAAAACVNGSAGPLRDLVAVLAAGSGVVGAGLVAAILWQAIRHRRMSMALERAAWPATLEGLAVGLVAGLDVPCVAGLVRARIYCPSDVSERLSQAELRAVLLHERHHQLVHAPAQLVVLAALSPVLRQLEIGSRWVERRRAAVEIAADVHAIRAGATRSALAQALLKFGSASPLSGLPSYASASELRLRHLIGGASPESRMGLPRALLILPIVVFTACLVQGLIA